MCFDIPASSETLPNNHYHSDHQNHYARCCSHLGFEGSPCQLPAFACQRSMKGVIDSSKEPQPEHWDRLGYFQIGESQVQLWMSNSEKVVARFPPGTGDAAEPARYCVLSRSVMVLRDHNGKVYFWDTEDSSRKTGWTGRWNPPEDWPARSVGLSGDDVCKAITEVKELQQRPLVRESAVAVTGQEAEDPSSSAGGRELRDASRGDAHWAEYDRWLGLPIWRRKLEVCRAGKRCNFGRNCKFVHGAKVFNDLAAGGNVEDMTTVERPAWRRLGWATPR